MAGYTYKGTKLTGMPTKAKPYPKSGIKMARKGQLYFNTSTGHVYKCTEGGKAKDAKWKYKRTDPAKKPNTSVSYLSSPTRGSGNRKMKATWKVPAAMIKKTSGSKATSIDITWTLGLTGKGKDPKKAAKNKSVGITSSTIDLNNLKIGRKTYTRSSFYPYKNKPKLKYVTVRVTSRNRKGAGKYAESTRKFTQPKKPSISAFTFNEVGELSCTITTDAGTGYAERYDTKYEMTVYYSNTKKTSTIYPNDIDDGTTTRTSRTLTFDDRNYASRADNDYAKVTVKAWARGFWGDSETVTKTFYIAYPAVAEIKSIKASGKTSSDKCVIYINTHSTDEHPVDRVKLEYLPNSIYSREDLIPAGADWQTTDIQDDKQCNALAMSVADLMPEPGRYTWIRLKTYHASELVLFKYSRYKRVTVLETPIADASDDNIQIVSAVEGADGRSALVNLVWDDGALPSTGTELTWDVEKDAWKSTKDPQSYEFEWSDGSQEVDGVLWPNSATITIKGLEEGETYYIRARRYNEGDVTTYSEYSQFASVVPSEKPESVTATANRYVPRGAGLNVYWTFSGNALQQNWQIVKRIGEIVEGDVMWRDDAILAQGEGSISSAQVSAEKLEAHAENGELVYCVKVSTGSGWVVSADYPLTIIDKPTLSISGSSLIDGELQSNDMSIVFESNKVSDLKLIVTSQGCVSQFPDGLFRQPVGDTIYSNVYNGVDWTPSYILSEDVEVQDKRYYEYDGTTYIVATPSGEENPSQENWYEETGLLSTNITLPPALDFWDNGAYSLTAVATDSQTGLKSTEVTLSFSVAWAHQAPSAESTYAYFLSEDTEVSEDKNYYVYDSETQTYEVVITVGDENPLEEGWYEVTITNYVTLTTIDEMDDTGFHHQAVKITLTPPPNADTDDVYDIYRMTGDGAYLIGQSFPLTHEVTDEYAPFGEDMTNHYRIAVRTADGDVSFTDIEYVLEGDQIRLDWAEGFVEYPYSISISDSYKKDVDVRKHLNGSMGAYWNRGIERSGALSTDAIKIIQKEEIDATRQLGRYTGPVFVRTREGTAFEADVQISSLETKNSAVMSIAIDAVEIDLTEEFMLPLPFALEEVDEENENESESESEDESIGGGL